MRVGQLWRTIQPIPWPQRWALLKHRLRRMMPMLEPSTASLRRGCPMVLRTNVPIETGAPVHCPEGTKSLIDLDTATFCFQRETRSLGRPIDWDADEAPLLWRYHLHYHDWLWWLPTRDIEILKQMVSHWIEGHRCSTKAVGWQPYPLSLRLINWSLLLLEQNRESLQGDAEFWQQLMQSYGDQWRWLERHVEWHLGANHLLENLAALQLGLFYLKLPDSWQARAKQIEQWLLVECQQQVLPDGVHYERSPMYQLRVLWLLEVLAPRCHGVLRRQLEETVERMRKATGLLLHSNDQPALFNDSMQGVYSIPDSVRHRRCPGAWALPDAGYYGFHSQDGESLWIDAAPIGPDHQPGHGHADLFTFEWSRQSESLLTDTGVFHYLASPQRDWDRSTAAHNTVTVDGENSCEVWSSFRVGKRVKPTVLDFQFSDRHLTLEASHAGYAPTIHRRRWHWTPGHLVVHDWLEGAMGRKAVSHWHLAPGWVGQQLADRWVFEGPGGRAELMVEGADQVELMQSPYSPQMGVRILRPNLLVFWNPVEGEPCVARWKWQHGEAPDRIQLRQERESSPP
ncbi:MAG: heparinase II/III family protein [Pirellulaceae bacterium]